MKKKSRQLLSRIAILLLLAVLYLFTRPYLSPSDQDSAIQNSDHKGILEVHFIDVGQGDAILVQSDHSAMLIDAGENNQGSTVSNYLRDKNIESLEYVIGTHPHSDHIGGLDTIIRSFDIKKILFPYVTHTTKTYEDVLDALSEKKLTITKPKVGDRYTLGAASFTIIAPNSDSYDEINNYSIGIKLTFGNTSFLLAGDAEQLSEEEMLDQGMDLSSDVLKLSHHGSAYSSGADFLDAVNPKYGMISVGSDNKYGHPSKETLKALAERDIEVYRTDKQGTVIFTSDGTNISVTTQKNNTSKE